MRNSVIMCVLFAGACARSTPAPVSAVPGSAPVVWPQHAEDRPQPTISRAVGAVLTAAPADATVLFDGRSLEGWSSARGGAARWKVENGYIEVIPGSGDIRTTTAWGDVQLHVEWATPLPPTGEGQNRGNSGVFLMERYEVQVLDSYGNTTYPDGQAAAVYGQFPPLVNASLPPGEWQSYDIIFHRPRFDGNAVVRPARVTVIHNGVVVQDNVELMGPTSHRQRAPYEAHADRLPLRLQDHGQPVRFRNIWIRDLSEQ